MSQENEEFTLRDKIALAILEVILADNKDQNIWSLKDYINFFDEKDQDNTKCLIAMERNIRAAYKFADMVRKVRLSAFE